MTLSLLEQRVLAALRARLTTRFGDRLASMTLFGSRARSEGHEESDLDVLVLVNGLSPVERRAVFDDALAVELETGLPISPLPRARETFMANSALAGEIRRDGIPL